MGYSENYILSRISSSLSPLLTLHYAKQAKCTAENDRSYAGQVSEYSINPKLTELIFYGLPDKSLTILIIYSLKSSSHIKIQNSQSKFAIIWTSGINYSHISLISSKKTIFTI